MGGYLFKNTEFLIGGAMLIASIVMLLAVPFISASKGRYEAEGITVSGTVVQKQVRRGSSRSDQSRPDYIVTYEFENERDRTTIRGRDQVSLGIFNGLNAGDRVPVQYLESSPETNRLASEGGGGTMFLVGALGLGFGAIGAFLVRRSLIAAKRLKALADTGRPHKATVLDIKRTNTRVGQQYLYRMVYEYEGPNGELIEDESQASKAEAFLDISKGDDIDILVDVTDPSKSAWLEDIQKR